MGTIVSVGGWIDTATYVRERHGADAREFGEDRARDRDLGTQNHGKSGGDPGDAGAYDDWGGGTTPDGDAGARADERAAAGGKGL